MRSKRQLARYPPVSPSCTGINPPGAIVGNSFDANFVGHGFLRAADGTFITVDPPLSAATFLGGINPAGAISGSLGGRRWWFLCPRTGQRAARLHLPPGAYTFACRKAYRLAYRSQRETPPDRALSRAFALRKKLGANGGTGDYIAKPKGMHRRTFERAMARIRRAEDIVDMYEALLLGRSS